jgi:hypothetical protein
MALRSVFRFFALLGCDIFNLVFPFIAGPGFFLFVFTPEDDNEPALKLPENLRKPVALLASLVCAAIAIYLVQPTGDQPVDQMVWRALFGLLLWLIIVPGCLFVGSLVGGFVLFVVGALLYILLQFIIHIPMNAYRYLRRLADKARGNDPLTSCLKTKVSP